MTEVFITKVSKFLPNEPVSVEEMEKHLGYINNEASKAKRIILRNNGIKTRYYATDKDGNSTHTNAEISAQAVRNLYDDTFTENDIEVLSCGSTTPDQLLPSHAVMVHGLLKNKSMELNSASGACCSGMNALKYGYMAVKSGSSNNAVCVGSEKTSSWMQSNKFEGEVENLKKLEEQPIVAFKREFLRWMLSDGAGAFLLENKPNSNGLSCKIEWMEGYSYAHEVETCMYAGGDKLEDGSIQPWSNFDSQDWLNHSVFALKQDVKLLDKNILVKGAISMKCALDKHKVDASEIDYFLPHVSSNYFVKGLCEQLAKRNVYVPMEKWFMNLPYVGNIGAASIYVMLEELMGSGKLKKGDKILLSVPESARFSYMYAYLTVC
ncbi:MAG: beta-ketoacyl-ACP synthase III [Flavobacterium sp.]|nr:beta-ketoacyl-ACP synthase III [Flavobacterium sp.]